ncbi:MAG: gamma-glutamyl-gamma-aminobutyrate hydrolase PuuD [Planctomycetota bacterium]|jgi:gamma-glutamyl-gamma-aminobutyrate hydrolase PuuD
MSSSTSPLIGVNGLLSLDREPSIRIANRYLDAILGAGGTPLTIPILKGSDQIRELLQRIDGLLLTGGDDFETEGLGLGPTHPSAQKTPCQKQEFDLELARIAIEEKLPVLGICYGMQLLGLNGGSGLHQHLPEDRPGCQQHAGGKIHAVYPGRGTKLHALLNVDEVPAVSRHHQALTHGCTPWLESAHDSEGLVEAIENPSHPFALGVQWHPELSESLSPHGRLFTGLVEAAREHHRTRTERPILQG